MQWTPWQKVVASIIGFFSMNIKAHNQRSEIPQMPCAHIWLSVHEMQTHESVVIEVEYISF